MNLKIKLVFTFVLLIFSIASKAQYKITVQINNLKDSTIYLGYYFGDKQYAKDTAVLNSKGKAIFEGNESLPGGLYFILTPGNSMFEIMIDNQQEFSVSTVFTGDPADLTKNLSAKGNPDLDLYINYQQFMAKQGEKAMRLRKQLQDQSIDEQLKLVAKDSLQILNTQVKAKWDEIENNFSKTLLASILRCVKEIEVPDAPTDENGVITDSMFQYHYYKAHYFDYIDFSDARLLRTKFFHDKIDRYFEKMIIPAPDTVIKESKMVLDKAEANEEVFQYTLQILFNKYNNSNIMGMDKAFVFFADNYYLNGKADWADSAWLEKVRERALEIRPNLIGNRAHNMKLIENDGSMVELNLIDADYTVLFFFEPGCGHCKKTTDKLKTFVDNYWEKGVEVLAIYTQFEKDEWDKFIETKQTGNWINAWDPYNQSGFRNYYDVKATPTIYLLDKNKRIIGKRIDAETLEKMLIDIFKKK